MMNIGEKVKHVKAAKLDPKGRHECHWPGCRVQVPPAMWGCSRHWYTLPRVLRNKIWRTYRAGQEDTKTPSPEYIAVAREVQEWIDSRPPHET